MIGEPSCPGCTYAGHPHLETCPHSARFGHRIVCDKHKWMEGQLDLFQRCPQCMIQEIRDAENRRFRDFLRKCAWSEEEIESALLWGVHAYYERLRIIQLVKEKP